MVQILPAVIWYGTSSLWLMLVERWRGWGGKFENLSLMWDWQPRAQTVETSLESDDFQFVQFRTYQGDMGNSESDDGVIIRSEETPDESFWPWGGPGKGSPGSKKQCISCARIAFPSFLLSLNFLLFFQFTSPRLCVRVRCLLFVFCDCAGMKKKSQRLCNFGTNFFYFWSLNSLSALLLV